MVERAAKCVQVLSNVHVEKGQLGVCVSSENKHHSKFNLGVKLLVLKGKEMVGPSNPVGHGSRMID